MTIWDDGNPVTPTRAASADPLEAARQVAPAASGPTGRGAGPDGAALATPAGPSAGALAPRDPGDRGDSGDSGGGEGARVDGGADGRGVGAAKESGRLKPTQHTLRRLYLLSGNLCAFPECGHVMLNEHGQFVGQVAHIEAAEPLGPRYNPSMTDEDRRHITNLMLMCYAHHREVDLNPGKYDVDSLRHYKRLHERQFSQGGRLISVALRDRTQADHVTYPKTLARLDWARDWNFTEDQRQARINELVDYVEHFRKTPFELRRFFGAVVERRHFMRKSGVVERERVIRAADICQSFELPFEEVEQHIESLDAYGLAGFTEIWEPRILRCHVGIAIYPTSEGWHLWEDLAFFSRRAGVPLQAFTEDLDFERLDDLGPPAPPAPKRRW